MTSRTQGLMFLAALAAGCKGLKGYEGRYADELNTRVNIAGSSEEDRAREDRNVPLVVGERKVYAGEVGNLGEKGRHRADVTFNVPETQRVAGKLGWGLYTRIDGERFRETFDLVLRYSNSDNEVESVHYSSLDGRLKRGKELGGRDLIEVRFKEDKRLDNSTEFNAIFHAKDSVKLAYVTKEKVRGKWRKKVKLVKEFRKKDGTPIDEFVAARGKWQLEELKDLYGQTLGEIARQEGLRLDDYGVPLARLTSHGREIEKRVSAYNDEISRRRASEKERSLEDAKRDSISAKRAEWRKDIANIRAIGKKVELDELDAKNWVEIKAEIDKVKEEKERDRLNKMLNDAKKRSEDVDRLNKDTEVVRKENAKLKQQILAIYKELLRKHEAAKTSSDPK